MCVCMSVCLMSPFHVIFFEAYFAPTSRSWMSKVFRDRNPWEKGLERSGLRIEHFCWEVVENCRVKKKSLFSADFHSTWGQNWVHQQNNIFVGALHFDPWCTLNLISSHDHFPGLLLVTARGVKIGCINTTFLVLEHSILTLGALLTYYMANTSHIITFKAPHCIGATIRIGREMLCLSYAGLFLLNGGKTNINIENY